MSRGGNSQKEDDGMRFLETRRKIAQLNRIYELEEEMSRSLKADNRRQQQEHLVVISSATDAIPAS